MDNILNQLNNQIDSTPCNADLYVERALLHYKSSNLKEAYNDFTKAILIDNKNQKAKHYIEVIESIFSFEYRENYNV